MGAEDAKVTSNQRMPGTADNRSRVIIRPADDVRHDHMGAAFDGLVEHKPCGRGHDPYEEDRGEGPSDGPSEEAETKKDNA